MLDASLLVHSLHYGLILSAAMSALVLISFRLEPEAWLGDLPRDIQEAYGPIGARAKRMKILFGIPILILPLAFAVFSLHRFEQATDTPLTFVPASLMVFIIFNVFNLVDLLLLDWLIFVRVQPKWVVLPGTEGLAGYRDYVFHFRAFLIGLALTAVVSPLLAGGYLLLS